MVQEYMHRHRKICFMVPITPDRACLAISRQVIAFTLCKVPPQYGMAVRRNGIEVLTGNFGYSYM